MVMNSLGKRKLLRGLAMGGGSGLGWWDGFHFDSLKMILL